MLAIHDLMGPYRIEALIARGGVSNVWRARQTKTERDVALKVFLPYLSEDPDFASRALDGARAEAAIDHMNVAKVEDFGRCGDRLYLAIEYVRGVTLGAILRSLERSGERLTRDTSLLIASAICAGLGAVHRAVDERGRPLGLLHLDVSPYHVLASEAGEVKLIDCGFATMLRRGEPPPAGALAPKRLYVTPEQIDARAPEVDARADLFAAGILLYQMLTGRDPFRGSTDFQIYRNLMHGQLEPPSAHDARISRQVDRICLRLLERDPADRYQSGSGAARALADVIADPDEARASLARLVVACTGRE